MGMMKGFAAKRVENVLVYAHGSLPPSDEEWEHVLALYDGPAGEGLIRTLVHTEGAAPNAAQRARLNTKLGARRVRISVLTRSPLARAAGTAVHWFRPEVCIFGPNNLAAALAHLDVTGELASRVTLALRDLKHEVGLEA